MDPATHPESAFFRAHIGRAPLMFEGRIAWVRLAADPQPSADRKVSVFRRLSLTDSKEEAAIYPANQAAAVIAVLRTTYPDAQLDPATFDEWVLAESGPEER